MFWPIILLTLGLTIVLAFIFTYMNVEKIKADWPNQRCNPLVMFSGFLYKPSDDTRSGGEFAEENFTFCLNQYVDTIMRVVLGPILSAVSLQMNSTNSLMGATNIIRQLWANIWNAFNGIIKTFYHTFWRAGLQFRRIFEKLLSSYNRIGAVLTASLYAGLSVMNGMFSLFEVIKLVVIIVLSIIIGLFILLIFLLLPFVPVILIPVTTILATLGISVAGSEIFCIAPGTLVEMKDGSQKPIELIQLGDELAYDCGKVTGSLESRGVEEYLYSVDGALISGAHIMFDKKTHEWISVRYSGHPLTYYRHSTLFVLTTTSSKIPIRTPANTLLFVKDWEELSPKDYLADNLWDWIAQIILNGSTERTPIPLDRPIVGKNCLVKLYRGFENIHNVKIGDHIWDSKNGVYTPVLGVFKGAAENSLKIENDQWISDGNWIFQDGLWKHLSFNTPTNSSGYQLITGSGSFTSWVNGKEYMMRDFTEVGTDRIKDTYRIVEKRINLPQFK